MTLEQGPRNIEKVMVSSLDLNQVRDAVREVRASHPSSILADLVEEKIRALESASHHFVSGFFEDFEKAQGDAGIYPRIIIRKA